MAILLKCTYNYKVGCLPIVRRSKPRLKVDFHCRVKINVLSTCVKKNARKQFPLLRKIILLRCLFLRTFTCVFALQTLWALA